MVFGVLLAGLLIAQTSPPPPALWHPRVYFAFGRADLPPTSGAEMDEVARFFRRSGARRVVLYANADRAGPADLNQRLSEQRAEAVIRALEARGVPRAAVVVNAWGETRPAVPTDDGVAEPLNRAVHIDFSLSDLPARR